MTLTGIAAGTATVGGQNVAVESNRDPAAMHVVTPGIGLNVTVSTTGTCPGNDAVTVTAGTNVTYCYQVSNSGNTTVDAIVLTLSNGQTVNLGALAPGASTSYVAAPMPASATGTETAGVTGTDPYGHPVSSSDSAVVTVLVTQKSGATRTIGFYSTHPRAVAACLARNDNAINLGWLPLRDERYDNEIDAGGAGNGADRDSRVETAMSLAMGILKANVAKWTNGQKRGSLEKARMQASQQVLAAICNSATATPPFSLTSAVQTLAGTNVQAILTLNAQADLFNNSGDSISLGTDYGPADSQVAWDDPSDPNDEGTTGASRADRESGGPGCPRPPPDLPIADCPATSPATSPPNDPSFWRYNVSHGSGCRRHLAP